MKKDFIFSSLIFIIICCPRLYGQDNQRAVIPQENGDIILAYKGFEQFLNSPKDWNDYLKYVLHAYPTLRCLHQRYIKYGLNDSVLYKKQVSDYTIDDFALYLNRVKEKQFITLYDNVIKQMDSILTPRNKVDICFFLPYGDCFVQEVAGRQTVFISIKYDMDKMDLILMHEYAHCLHHQRRPQEPSVLKRWIVSEGIASFFPLLVSRNYSIYEGLWMMPRENIDWCRQHEPEIIDSIRMDLDKQGMEISKKYIAGGEGFARPPRGFPEKTGYYLGYRLIEKCMDKGMALSDICILDSKAVMDSSGVFEIHQ